MLYPNKYQSNEIDFEEYKQDSKRIIDFNDTVPIAFKEGEGWVLQQTAQTNAASRFIKKQAKRRRILSSLSLKLFGKCVIK